MKHLRQLSTWTLRKLGLKVEHPINQNPSAQNEREPPNPETSGTTPITRIIEDVRDTIIQEYQRSQNEQRAENHRNRTIAKWAVAGAWIYAGIAAFQWSELRMANRQSSEALKITERAYVSLGDKTE